MQTAELDFYAPGVDHRRVRRERLEHQRQMMFSWRQDGTHTDSSSATTHRHRSSYTNPNRDDATRGFQSAPQQVILAGSARAKAIQKAETERCARGGCVWDSAVGQPHDRRREWRATGLQFTRSHFRTSTDPASVYHPRNKAQHRQLTLAEKRQAIQEDTYEPYWHDRILLSKPTEGQHVVAIAVTTNNEEAQQAEADAAALQAHDGSQADARRSTFDATQMLGSDDTAADRVDTWFTALGGSVASRQRGAQTAEAMYSELMAQQATLTGTAYGSPESRNVHVPTGELAYTVRPAFAESHAGRTHRGRASRTASAHGPDEEAVCRSTLNSQTAGPGSAPPVGAPTGTHNGVDGVEGKPFVHTSAEAKSMRVYAVDLRCQVSNKDTSMVARQEPTRRGVPVVLPSSWVSPGTTSGS